MNGIQRITDTINRKNSKSSAFWVGHPTDDAKEIYYKHFNIKNDEETEQEKKNKETSTILANKSGKADIEFSKKIQSDMVWLSPEIDLSCWKHPQGKPMWDVHGGKKRTSLNQPGVFAETTDISEIDNFDWPNPDYLDLTPVRDDVKYAVDNGIAAFGGMWCPFWHTVADFFGMENYFIKMYTDPDIVQAVTERVVDFYMETNRRCLDEMSEYLVAGFFGNDLGSQLDLMVSYEMLDKFVFPYYQKIIDLIKSKGLKVAHHSCGAISSIIPKLIDMGVDILHPLQALAPKMDAQSLKQYKDDIIFMGGIDTQQLLPFGTPEEVADEVRRVKDILGPGYIISPSHEALLKNVPVKNVIAMSEAAKE